MSEVHPHVLREARRHAALVRHVGAWIQPVFVAALFVLWMVCKFTFFDATGICVAAGVFVYSSLNVYAAIICAASGDGSVLAARVSRLLGVILYIIMYYFMHYGFWRSLGVWFVLWVVAWWLARKARKSAIAGAPVKLNMPRPETE